jgi:threonine dehydratase
VLYFFVYSVLDLAMPVAFEDLVAARDRIRPFIVETVCPASIPLSEICGMRIFCKLEYLQRTGSFKERGARNALMLLGEGQRKRGVIAASAGNHALGLAYHAGLLGIPVQVVMPQTAPLTKVVNCRKLGATVIVEGRDLAEARSKADEIAAREGFRYINGFDDPPIIAGQGTLGLEILDQVPDLDAIIVPIGGAGLIAGVALAIKTKRPSVKVIGVEPENATSFVESLAAKKPVSVQLAPTLADGLSVPKVGSNAFQIAQNLVDQTVLVTEQEIALAVLRLMELEKAVVEGAGATPLAACLSGKLDYLKGKRVVLPLCGGNIDMNTLGRVIERGLAFDGRLFRFATKISDRPGSLARLANLLSQERANVMDIHHERAVADQDVNTVTLHCLVETRDRTHIQTLREKLESEGFAIDQGGA